MAILFYQKGTVLAEHTTVSDSAKLKEALMELYGKPQKAAEKELSNVLVGVVEVMLAAV